MTASITAPLPLDPDSLEFAAFEKIRSIGPARADGATFVHEGVKYCLTVDTPCRLELTHAVLERINGPTAGYRQAIAILSWKRQDRHDVNGLGLMMQAMATGVVIEDANRPEKLSWRVLPMLPVPDCYAKPNDSDE